MPTYRHFSSQTMFIRFRLSPLHQPGLAERFSRITLLFTAFLAYMQVLYPQNLYFVNPFLLFSRFYEGKIASVDDFHPVIFRVKIRFV